MPLLSSLPRLSALVLFFLLSHPLTSQALTTTLPGGGVYIGRIQAGSAYISVPLNDGTGKYRHVGGYRNAASGEEALKQQLLNVPNPCGTSGALPDGYTVIQNGAVVNLNVYLTCRKPDGGTSTGVWGAVWGNTCPAGSSYYEALSSRTYTACSYSGVDHIKSVGVTGGPGAEESICSTCWPINLATGNKWLVEADHSGGGAYPLDYTRYYNSGAPVLTGAGLQWSGTYDRSLQISTNETYPIVGVTREDGRRYSYGKVNGQWAGDRDVTMRLAEVAGGGWTLTLSNNEVEHYDAAGTLRSITNPVGQAHTIEHDDAGRVSRVVGQGRQLDFSYDEAGYLTTLTAPGVGEYRYEHDAAGNLVQVTYPDGAVRQYRYGEATNVSDDPATGVDYTGALTGIIDETGVRQSSYWYDSRGRAWKEERAPVLNIGLDRNVLTYNYNLFGQHLSTTVTDALGAARGYIFTTIEGVQHTSGQTQPAGSGSAAAVSAKTFDANGNITIRTDFNGNKNCYAYDLTRNLETVRVEGLAPGKACPSSLASYQPVTTAGSVERKITTQWHATYRLPVLIAEPLRITTLTYDSATGNLLTSTVQPTTDATGGAGAGGTTTGLPRITTNTYYATSDARNGQLHTVDGPRTDVTDVTTYDYDSTTGDLTSISNALGQETRIGGYDGNGRPGYLIAPNGLITHLYHDARGRVTGIDAEGETTGYSYDAAGNLVRVDLPGGASYTYTYDLAHRLIRIADRDGNRIEYALDAAGNRTGEQILDAAGEVVRTHNRLFDQLGRLYQDIGAVNQTASLSYDPNGNLTRYKDPLNRQSINTFDALNRMLTSKDPANGITALGYDLQDHLVKVTDPRNLITQYTVDGLGNQSRLANSDTGITGQTVDAAGNVLTSTDAKGQLGTFTYDALNRVTGAVWSGPQTTPYSISYLYDEGENGAGRLTGVVEPTGATAYGYDRHGRLASEIRVAHGRGYTTTWTYDAAGRLASIGYPSGRLISYTFDSAGRVSHISTTPPGGGAATVLASNIQYAPFGGVKGFSFGDGTTAPVQDYARTFDLDGRIATYTLNGVLNTVGYDTASQITSITSAQYPLIPATYGYDNVSRLTSYIQNTTSHSYGYDADGNRTTQTLGTSTTTYTYQNTSNRLTGIVHGGTTSVSHDANGSIINDFDRQYTYDLRGRLVQTTTTLGSVNYEVDAQGLRVRKQAAYVGGADTMFFYDATGHLIGEVPTGTGTFAKEYVYLGDMPLAVSNSSDGFNYVHVDHLGTPRVITNTAAQVVWQWDNLDPFGNNAPNENPSGLGVYHYDIGFAGQYRDRETNTVYNIFRDHYFSDQGRYGQSDPIGLKGASFSTYTYVNGNPISYSDPTGLCPWCIGGAIIGGVINAASQYSQNGGFNNFNATNLLVAMAQGGIGGGAGVAIYKSTQSLAWNAFGGAAANFWGSYGGTLVKNSVNGECSDPLKNGLMSSLFGFGSGGLGAKIGNVAQPWSRSAQGMFNNAMNVIVPKLAPFSGQSVSNTTYGLINIFGNTTGNAMSSMSDFGPQF